jgi:hypothetical protein
MDKIIKNGYSFIEKECLNGFFNCYLSPSRSLNDFNNNNKSDREIGSSGLILMHSSEENRKNKEISSYLIKQIEQDKFHFFEDRSLLPCDVDTSAFILSTLFLKNELAEDVIKKAAKNIILNINSDKLILVFFELHGGKNQLDHVAMTNVLYLLNLVGMSQLAEPTLEYVLNKLETKEYLKGSRYYHSPLTFLYFFSRLFDFNNFQQFKEIIKKQLTEIPLSEYPIDIACRIIISKKLGIKCYNEITQLIGLQAVDGGWSFDGIYKFGKREQYFGSRAIATSFALKALEI